MEAVEQLFEMDETGISIFNNLSKILRMLVEYSRPRI